MRLVFRGPGSWFYRRQSHLLSGDWIAWEYDGYGHQARPGRWYFLVHEYPQEDFEDKEPMEDKEAALEALKEWLLANVQTTAINRTS